MRKWRALAAASLLGILGVTGCGEDPSTNFEGAPDDTHLTSGGSEWNDAAPIPAIHNTDFCQVNAQGQVTSADRVAATDGDRIYGVGGGCVNRPLRELWGVVLNHAALKASDVDEYRPTALTQLLDPAHGIYGAFDIESIVHALGGLVTVKWTTRWFHTLKHGKPQTPCQLVITGQKIRGTSHVAYQKESYVIDRVTANVTSFAMEQTIKATQVDPARVKRNILTILDKMRKVQPAMGDLPKVMSD